MNQWKTEFEKLETPVIANSFFFSMLATVSVNSSSVNLEKWPYLGNLDRNLDISSSPGRPKVSNIRGRSSPSYADADDTMTNMTDVVVPTAAAIACVGSGM